MHNLELIYFPKGKGLPKWQQDNGKIFLGIDHTAIGISNTDSSLQFYANVLGMERKGDSWNKGIEQAHLNFVENASLHITGLRANQGPGIEFLQYLIPGPGKPFPADSKADDIWHWQTTVLVEDAGTLYNRLKAEGYKLLSLHPANLHNKAGKMARAFIVRDRDGHAVLIREPFIQS